MNGLLLNRIQKWGRDGAAPSRSPSAAPGNATRGWRVNPGAICSARSARAGSAQRAVPPIFRKGSLRNSALILFGLLLPAILRAAENVAPVAENHPLFRWADATRLGRPLSKDPSVVRFGGRYLMYFSLPPFGTELAQTNAPKGWNIGIAESTNLVDWKKTGELLPAQACDANGLCAPGARVLDGNVHLFYQTYGNFPKDAICHAVSADGIHFVRDASNPVFHPTGEWNNGRAIDAEVIPEGDRLLLYFATRDAAGVTQMLGVASAPLRSDYSRETWTQVCDRPILKPELAWETRCIEAPAIAKRGDTLVMFYAGGFNNDPQQIGVATSRDGVRWERQSHLPLLPNGPAGEWNSSESGHPGFFADDDGRSYLFFQGNNDRGKTWHLSCAELEWKGSTPQFKKQNSTHP